MRTIIVGILSLMFGFSSLHGMVEKEISTELAYSYSLLDFLSIPLEYMYYTDPFTIYPGLNSVQIRYAESMCFGLTPMSFKGVIKFKFIWDPDSVCAGDSFRLYIVAYTDTVYETDPYHGGGHEVYSNFGFSIGMGFQRRKYNFSKLRFDEWEDLPIGFGIDGNLHIEGDGRLPLSGDTLEGEDELTITGIGMDVFLPEGGGGGGGGGKSSPDSLSKSGSDVSASELLGLIDLLSVNFGFGIRIRDGYIRARLSPTFGNFYLSGPYELTWHHQGDTQMVWVHVMPHAIRDHFGGILQLAGEYVAPYSWRGFESIHFMGIEIGRFSSRWVEEENPVQMNFSQHELEEVYIPLTGESHVPTHPDVRIEDVRVTTFESRLPTPQYITPEVGKTSFVNFVVTNIGDGDLWGFSLKIIYPDTVHTISYHDTTIYPNGMISVTDTYTWRNPGLYEVRFIAIPDSGNNQVNYSNDTLNVKVFVRKRNILARISVVDRETGSHIPISSNYYSRINVIGMRTNTVAVPDTLGTGIYWLALIPCDDTVNITAIPDSSHRELFMTTRRVRMDTVNSDTLDVNLILWGRGTVQGYVFLPDSSPAESAMVSIAEVNRVFTDSTGFFIFENLPQADSITGRYRLKVYLPGRISITDSFYLPRNDTVNFTFYLENYDTIPPVGRVEIDPVVTRNFTIHLFARDTLTASGDTVPPVSVLIRDNLSSWDTIPYGLSFDKTVDWTIHTRTNQNEVDTVFVKFVDYAGNIGSVITQPVIVDQEGPYGEFTINHGDSITFNTTIRITDVSIDSTLVPVREIHIRELGGVSVTYPFVPGEEYSFRVFNNYLEGDHIIGVRFVDSLGVSSEEKFDTIFVSNYGSVYINDDEQFTNASVVDLTIDAYKILAHNTIGDQQMGGYPLAQSFIPHESQITGAKIFFNSAESGIKIAIFTLTHDTTQDTLFDQVVPGELLAYQELPYQISNPEVAEVNFDPPVTVYPESTYFLVIFKDSIEEGYTNFSIIAGNDENYTEGSLYGSPMKGLMWYNMDADMCFIIEGSLDYMKISNTPEFNSNWIPFQRVYHNWELEPGEGLRTVYVRVRGGNFERTFHDEIYVDKTQPDTGWIRLLNHGEFLETTQCTLLVGGNDSYSGMGSYRINNSAWLPFLVPPFTIIYNVDSGPPGPRSITAVFRDKAGNFYTYPDTITIDFDPYGPSGRLVVGNNGVSSSDTVLVHIELDKYKGKYISIDSMRFSFNRIDWGEWGPFTTDTVFVLPGLGINPVYAELMDNHGRRNILLGTCIVDTSPPEPVVNVRDEGDLTENHSYLSFSWDCQGDFESGIDHFVIKIAEDPQVNNVLYQFDVPSTVRNYPVGPMSLSGGSIYYAKVVAVNRVGLTRESEPTDGITVVNGIQCFTLISPSDSSNLRHGDTVRFVWHEAQDVISTITEYSVFIDDQIVASVSDTSFQYILNLDNGWHRWYVVARDSLLDQRSSDTLCFHVGNFNPPPVPNPISPADTAFNYDTVRFVWSPGSKKPPIEIERKEEKVNALARAIKNKQDVTYNIEVSDDSTFSVVGTTGDTQDTTIVLTVPEGILWWRISAVNEWGSSEWSIPLRFIVDTTPPVTPVPITPHDTLYTSDVQFSWHPSTDNLTGIMYYILTCWSLDGFIEIDTLNDTTFTLTTNAGDYFYTVAAVDSVGNVSTSDTTAFSVRLITLPTPVLVSPPNDTIMAVVNYITFSWAPGKKSGDGRFSLNTPRMSVNSKDYMYEIRFSNDSAFSNIRIVDTTSATSITENLWEGYVYWQVRAIDSSGNISLWSAPWRVVLDTTRPQVPYLVYPPDSAVIETNSVHFIWRSSSDFTGIDHYLLGYEHLWGDTSEIYSVTTTDTEMVIDGLENGEWTWYVNAYDSAGNYKFSGYRDFTVNYLPPLPVPTIVQPSGNPWLPVLVVFKWRIDSTKGGISEKEDPYYFIVQVMRGEPVYTDTVTGDSMFTFLPSGNYTWHVRTYQNGRTSEWSPVDSFRVDGFAPYPPQPISPCNGCFVNTLPVEFVWSSTTDSLSGLVGYRLSVADNPDMMNPIVDTLMQDTTFSLGLGEGEWYWQVGGVDSAGNYASYDIQVFYIDTTAPAPVVLVSPPDSFLYGLGDFPIFIWHPTEGLKKKMGKEVYYEVWVTDGDTLVYPELTDTVLWMDTVLADGWYHWFVRAYDEHGNFSQSEVRVFGFDNTPPVIESTTVIHDTSYRGPYLIRTYAYDENGLSYIKLFYGFNERLTDSVPMTADTIPDHYYCYIPTIPDSFNDTVTVIYYILAYDNAYEPNMGHDPSDSAYTFHVYPVGVNDVVPPSEFSVTVRSVSGKPRFIISVPVAGIVKISVYAVDGRKVFGIKRSFNAGYHRVILDRALSTGVYFLEASYRGRRLRRKLIVVR